MDENMRVKWDCLDFFFFSLASLAQLAESKNTEAISRESHEEEMDRLKLEIQQCKDFIQAQQQLIQVRPGSQERFSQVLDDIITVCHPGIIAARLTFRVL